MNYLTQQEAKAAHVRKIKENAACKDCHDSGTQVELVFVRSDGTRSPRSVGKLVQGGSFESLIAEIELSDTVCRLCKTHRQRLRWRRRKAKEVRATAVSEQCSSTQSWLQPLRLNLLTFRTRYI
jgi:hypothetical protein